MENMEEEFLKKLLLTFKIEAKEHTDAITEGLISLEKASPENEMNILESIFRESHSLKGAARSVNLKDIEFVCQHMESIFSSLKRKEISTSLQLFDVLHQATDCVDKLVLMEGEVSISEKAHIKEIILNLESVLKGASGPSSAPGPLITEKQNIEERPKKIEISQLPSMRETVRIPTAKLDSLLFQTEEMLSVKLSASQRAEQLRDIYVSSEAQKVSNELLDKLKTLAEDAEYDSRHFGGMIDNMLDDMKKVLMLPFSSLSGLFPKLVRDLSRQQGKDVGLVVKGEEINIDRRILEELKDPLIHLIRNCIDHGMEKPDERKLKKKPPQGTIKLSLSAKDGNKIEISVSDDGAGIDISRIKSSAITRGILSQEQAAKLSDQEALSLIFLSGVSTSPIITEISGRGLGLAIVHEKVEKLNGIVSFETKPDIGTTFRVIVPLSLSTFRGLLINENQHMFVLPVTNVTRVLRISKEEIKTVENRETISLDGEVIPLFHIRDVLEFQGKRSGYSGTFQIVVISSSGKHIAFMVDEILNEQEILVKKLGRQLSRIRNISGATVLGSGKVVPILNAQDLIKSAMKLAASPLKSPQKEVKEKRKSVLVVEDSITARTLLKNILQTAGYDVKTAVDGLDGFRVLKTQEFDAVVSDVDMPGMNGFDLTKAIRNTERFYELPVVLVTALESREDKERGIEAGANAYIVKSSFDQSNLLEVIQRLI